MKHILNLETTCHLLDQTSIIRLPQFDNVIPKMTLSPLKNDPENVFLELSWTREGEEFGVSVTEGDEPPSFEDGILTFLGDEIENNLKLALFVPAQITPKIILQEESNKTEEFLAKH